MRQAWLSACFLPAPRLPAFSGRESMLFDHSMLRISQTLPKRQHLQTPNTHFSYRESDPRAHVLNTRLTIRSNRTISP
jgi:hypothetical protein